MDNKTIRDILNNQGWDCGYVIDYLHKNDNRYYTDVYKVYKLLETAKVLYCPMSINGKTVVLRRNDFI